MKADLVRCTTARILPIECQLTGGTMVTSGNAGNGRVQVRLNLSALPDLPGFEY